MVTEPTPSSIQFPNGASARVAAVSSRTPAPEIVASLGLAEPRPVISVVGGAAELDKRLVPRIGYLFARAIVKVAAAHDAVIVDGGTQAGIMGLMGQAVADRGGRTVLLGLAPAGKVTYPNGPVAAGADSAGLEPNHTHFVLVQSDAWGGEVETRDAVMQTVANGQPGVTVLANGGPIALDEVLRSVRRKWPVVVLAGSGRLADQIAQLARQRRRRFIADPRLAEIIEDGTLDIFPATGTADDLARTLERHLRAPDSDPALDAAWKQFAFLDANAKSERTGFDRLQFIILLFGVLATALALLQTQFGADISGDALHVVLLLVTLVTTVLIGASIRFKAGSRWVILRGGAETIKREIFRYRAGVGPYSPSVNGKTTPGSELAARVAHISEQVFGTDVTELALKPYRGPIPPPMYGAAADDSGYGPLTPAQYVAFRITDQIAYYQGRAAQLDTRLRLAQWSTLVLGAAATFLAAVARELWVPLATAAGAAVATYLGYQQIGPTLAKFNQAGASLTRIQEWWQALPPAERTSQSNVEKLVSSTEQVLEGELTGWVRQMRDALERLYAEERRRAAERAQ